MLFTMLVYHLCYSRDPKRAPSMQAFVWQIAMIRLAHLVIPVRRRNRRISREVEERLYVSGYQRPTRLDSTYHRVEEEERRLTVSLDNRLSVCVCIRITCYMNAFHLFQQRLRYYAIPHPHSQLCNHHPHHFHFHHYPYHFARLLLCSDNKCAVPWQLPRSRR